MTNDPNVRRGKVSSAQALLEAAPAEQVDAAIQAEKWARAADLLAMNGERLLLDGEHDRLVIWLAALPDEHAQRNPKLSTLHAWALLYQQRFQDALKHLSLAERALQGQKLAEAAASRRGEYTSDELELKPHAELEQSMAAVRAHLASVTGDQSRIPKSVEEIMLPASADHPCWRAAALLTLGRCRYLAGDLHGAHDDLEAAFTLASHTRGARPTRIAAEALVLLGRVATARGALTAALGHYDVVDAGTLPEAKAAAAVGRAEVALLRNDRAAARAALAIEMPDGVDPMAAIVERGLIEVRLAALDGEYDDAKGLLDVLEKKVAANLRWTIELVQAHRARLALFRGDDAGARRWLQSQNMTRPAERLSPIAAFEVVTRAMAELKDDAALALASAGRALAFAEETGHKLLGLEALLVTGLAQYRLGHRDEARSALVAAIEGAGVEGASGPLLNRMLDEPLAELGLDSPSALALRQAVNALPEPMPTSRERPFTPRPGTITMGPIETKQVAAGTAPPVSTEPAVATEPAEATPPLSPSAPERRIGDG